MKHMVHYIPDARKVLWGLSLTIFFGLGGCKKFLDEKPDKQLTTPETLQDLRALLDNDNRMNRTDISLGDYGSDYYYLTAADWEALSSSYPRSFYVWQDDETDTEYKNQYQKIVAANVVLDNIDKVRYNGMSKDQWNEVKGQALFFRAHTFFRLAQVYSMPYNPSTASTELGIPIRLVPDIDVPTIRVTVQETFDRIFQDLREAVMLLPVAASPRTRPDRSAAYALLSNVSLVTQRYDQALKYADSCVNLFSNLTDYNTLPVNASNPFGLFHGEVIFHSIGQPGSIFSPARCKVDSNLYRSYDANDLRKALFFKSNGNGTYSFKGHYSGGSANTTAFFSGIASDEVYLIKAECEARAGLATDAMHTLNTLLEKRWKTGTFVPLQAADAQAALVTILAERRKELCFRTGSRWMDLRRLNEEGPFKTTLKRKINNDIYELPPGDLHYAFLIPQSVVDITGIPQTRR